MKKYLVYFEEKIYSFATWNECKKFVSDKKCKYRKIESEEDEAEFMLSLMLVHPKKIYIAITKDNAVQTFEKWTDCKEFVDKNENCICKSFEKVEDAQDFINRNIKAKVDYDLDDVMYCYINGAGGKKENHRGFVAIKNNKVVKVFNLEDKDVKGVGSELLSTIAAIKYAVSKEEGRVIIIHNFQGTKMWANGSWKCLKDNTKKYKKEYDLLKYEINIDFIHCQKDSADKALK